MKKVTVPGSLLLLGEYAVLEPGGLGVSLAVEKRVILTSTPAEELTIRGTFGQESFEWREEEGSQNRLVSAVVESCRTWLRSEKRRARFRAALHIDSSAFFRTNGRKSGYGSSAAVCIGLAIVLLNLAGLSGKELTMTGLRIALEAHRNAQGASGSGYDIITSLFGRIGLFKADEEPSWTPCSLSWLPSLYLFWGERSVSTPDAIKRYLAWRREDPSRARRFTKESNRTISRFVGSSSWDEAKPYFLHSKDLALSLGREIGVDAEMVPPLPLVSRQYKALGAGNEIGVYVSPKPVDETDALERLVIAERGISWE